jgi:hypothetical protein
MWWARKHPGLPPADYRPMQVESEYARRRIRPIAHVPIVCAPDMPVSVARPDL